MEQIQTQKQDQISSSKPQPRLEFRASCDPCAASKVRCTKEQRGCSRCVQNGLKCVYGRSRRKGKPPSKKFTFVQSSFRDSQVSPPAPIFPQTSPVVPAPSPSWASGQYPSNHQSNYNYDCPWSRSPMFPMASDQDQTLNNVMPRGWERRTVNSLDPHQSLLENSVPPMSANSGYMSKHNPSGANSMAADSGDFGSLSRKTVPGDKSNSSYDDGGDDDDESDEEREELEDVNEDRHEPCIAVACRLLSSLSRFRHCDCRNGHPSNDRSVSNSRDQCKPLTLEEKAPPSDTIFCMTQSATEDASRLLSCTGSVCAQDTSTLLVLGAVLSKILTWYQALYQSEIGRHISCPPVESHHSNSSRTDTQPGLSSLVDGTADSLYDVPLTIPLSVGNLNIPHATKVKMKAQLLLCQLQSLYLVCQALDRRAQGAENLREEGRTNQGSNAQLLEQVDELQRILTLVCTQPSTT
ncbi:transcriptional regulator family: Fungal Specific TF [Penicillium coprophilum]|uniref:transcriptional regulator family: Fungal Specific TF n=1 Tax=Penicillium coprophilum TaxID=36646 RepID=UPI0023A122E3|nr:transcriptional regulator family: Fungal Specific TF [Penicillium coprophilum]KAJ5178535.1 transcriptional regulator family: Fungal Specific TF [Penicillium coprophilum]